MKIFDNDESRLVAWIALLVAVFLTVCGLQIVSCTREQQKQEQELTLKRIEKFGTDKLP